MSPSKKKLTQLRKATAPLLPPPLLRLIHAVDTYAYLHRTSLNASTADEATATLLSTIFVAWLLWRCIKAISVVFRDVSRSTAHLSEESVLKQLSGQGRADDAAVQFDDTVIFCGAMNSGKTCLLHRLLLDNASTSSVPLTVTSMAANAAYLTTKTQGDNTKKHGVVRIIDYPGHPSLSSQFTPLLSPSNTTRLVFTIDTTHPVSEATSLLYKSILISPTVRNNYNPNNPLHVLMTCTKTDVKGSKNYKRIKIQIRNEIERLRKVDQVLVQQQQQHSEKNGENKYSLRGKNIDLDNLGSMGVPVRLHFVEVAMGNEDGVEAVREFVLNGVVPNLAEK